MSATRSPWRGKELAVGWAAFTALNLLAMVELPHYSTVPFHCIWISLVLLYGAGTWRLGPTLAIVALICATTGLALRELIAGGFIEREEVAEIPLMATIFLAAVWHIRRKQATAAESDRVAASERLLREHEQLFSRQASHELRSPLTLARGHVQLVHAAMPPGPLAADLAAALRQLDRMTAITTRLLAIGSLEHVATLEREIVDVPTLVRALVEPWAKAHDRTWRVSGTVAGPAMLDPVRFAAALDEILDNAVKQTASADHIDVSIESVGTELIVAVSDSGPGLPNGFTDCAFETFWRAPGNGYHGAGLGLSIVKAVAVAHGGDAYVRPVDGTGATFVMTYPGAVMVRPHLLVPRPRAAIDRSA